MTQITKNVFTASQATGVIATLLAGVESILN